VNEKGFRAGWQLLSANIGVSLPVLAGHGGGELEDLTRDPGNCPAVTGGLTWCPKSKTNGEYVSVNGIALRVCLDHRVFHCLGLASRKEALGPSIEIRPTELPKPYALTLFVDPRALQWVNQASATCHRRYSTN
jgi:hypothetical protein